MLFVGSLTSTGLGAAASILIARLLGPGDFGLYALAIAAPNLLQFLTHFGTRTAVTRYVAYHLSRGEVDKARRYALSSIAFALVAGALLSLVGYLRSGLVASDLFGRPSLQPYIALGSVGIGAQSVMLAAIAASTGWNSMSQASVTDIVQQGAKMVVAPLLILSGFGLGGAVAGHVVSFLLAGVVGVVMIYATKIRVRAGPVLELARDAKELLKFGFLPFVGYLLSALSVFYMSLLLSAVADKSTIGFYQAALYLILPATLLATATANALYPAFASLHGSKGDIGTAFMMSVKYVGYVVAPILFFMAAASTQLMELVYGSSYSAGAGYLVLLSLAYVPMLLGLRVIPNFFNGIGQTRLSLFATGGSAIVIFAAAPLLALLLGLGVPGIIYSIFISNATLVLIGLGVVWKGHLGRTDLRAALALLVSGGLALAACWLLPALGSGLITLLLKLIVFFPVYLTLAPVLGALSQEDVKRIAESVRGAPVVGALLLSVLSYEGYLASFARR